MLNILSFCAWQHLKIDNYRSFERLSSTPSRLLAKFAMGTGVDKLPLDLAARTSSHEFSEYIARFDSRMALAATLVPEVDNFTTHRRPIRSIIPEDHFKALPR